MKVIKKIPNNFLLFSIFFLIFTKVIIYFLIKNSFLTISLGGGNDADYYDSYALGYESFAVNIWPVILNYLNNIGLYSRDNISYVLFFINLFIIPILLLKITGIRFIENQKYCFYIILLCLLYPTLFFYTFDIYRDVFMVLFFLVGCLTVKKSLNSNNFLLFIVLYLISIVIGLFLINLRPYLGYAFLISLFLWKIKLTKKRLIGFSLLYFIMLFIANYIGIFKTLTEYRAGFEESKGGSTLNLDFSNPIMFLPNFILSTLGQLFGLYITNPFAIILFFIEVIPFIFMLFYIVKNIKLADNFIRFLIIFFVLYASVWLIGNDNLGTAIRLRIYNYFAIYICFFYILSIKSSYLKSSKVSNK